MVTYSHLAHKVLSSLASMGVQVYYDSPTKHITLVGGDIVPGALNDVIQEHIEELVYYLEALEKWEAIGKPEGYWKRPELGLGGVPIPE